MKMNMKNQVKSVEQYEELLKKFSVDNLERIKNLGYKVKLDTNGSNPETLKDLVNIGLIDYVAMDIKLNPKSKIQNPKLRLYYLRRVGRNLIRKWHISCQG